MVIAVKIGTNEPQTYTKYHKLTHSADIVTIFKQNVTTFGTQGDKQYFAIPVDVSEMSAEEVDDLIDKLVIPWMDGEEIIAERLYYVDVSLAPWLSQHEKDILVQGEYIKSNIKPDVYTYISEYSVSNHDAPSPELVSAYQTLREKSFDISSVNDFNRFVTLADVAKVTINKASKMTLAQELGL